ncbi:hypothetical protein C8F04DRAFT_1190931 [Mycena alexandri]|uniref:RRM domain-containing protein n=1 Tax=Mycena alexandri TaxID=1745969 RepID=A0AAD6SDL8_9AGAR|nr:hypothetical protein C8F04DRAFT_1190931 [Mycena alexandri]
MGLMKFSNSRQLPTLLVTQMEQRALQKSFTHLQLNVFRHFPGSCPPSALHGDSPLGQSALSLPLPLASNDADASVPSQQTVSIQQQEKVQEKAQEGDAKALQQVARRPQASNGGRQPGSNVQCFHARGFAEQQARAHDRSGALEQGQSVQHPVLPGFTPNSMQRRQGFDESPAQAPSGSIDHGGGDTSVGGSGRPGRPVYKGRTVYVGNLPPNEPSAPSNLSACSPTPPHLAPYPLCYPHPLRSPRRRITLRTMLPQADLPPRPPHLCSQTILPAMFSQASLETIPLNAHPALSGKLYLLSRELRLTWPETTSPDVAEWVKRGVLESGATRSIFIRPLPSRIAAKSDLRNALESKFGYIESCKVVKDRTGERVGVVKFFSIGAGMRCLCHLSGDREASSRVFYHLSLTLRVDVAAREDRRGAAVTILQSLWTGANIQIKYSKDRCQRQPESQHTNTVLRPGSTGMGTAEAAGMGSAGVVLFQTEIAPSPPPSAPTHQNSISSVAASGHATNGGGVLPNDGIGSRNRCVWLGGISASTTTADLCDAIRGGMLHRISLCRSKVRGPPCAASFQPAHPTLTPPQFVTFIDPVAASAFFLPSVNRPGSRPPWASPRNCLGQELGSSPLALAAFSEGKLRADFGAFGGLERVRILKSKERQMLTLFDRNCAHVNFTHIWSAIRAVTAIAKRLEYAMLHVTYAQDRCERAPRPAPQPSQRSTRENGEVGSGESIGSDTGPKAGGTKATHSKNPPTAIQALQELLAS